MAIIEIFNPLLEEGIQKLNNISIIGGTASTTNATPTNIITKAIILNSLLSFNVVITAIRSGGTVGVLGDCWVHEYRGAIKNIGGTTSIVDSVTNELIAEDTGTLTALSVNITADDTGDELEIDVVGLADHNIEWSAQLIFDTVNY